MTLDDSGAVYEINLVGGEPTILPNFIELCIELTKKNYIFLSTNLSNSNVFDRMIEAIDPKHITGIDASFHVEQREMRSSFEQYAEYFLKLQEAGFTVYTNYVAHPRLMDRIETDFARLKSLGVEMKATPFIGVWENKSYPESYTEQERAIIFNTTANAGKWDATIDEGIKGHLCNAGYNVFWVSRNGVISKCTTYLQKTYGNIYKKVEAFDKKMQPCYARTCTCPYFSVLSGYFEKAKKECGLL